MSSDMSALVLVAHADDETLGAGGTIVKLIRRGWRVDVVILADGVSRTRGRLVPQDNRPGAVAACAILGAPPPHFLGFLDQRFDEYALVDLATAVGALGLTPDLILTHVPTDLNLDHRLCADVAKIIGRPKNKPVSILGVETPSTTFWNGVPFAANFYVDVTAEIETKIAAFTQYEHELQAYPHPWSVEGLRLLAQYHGMQAGFPFAEAFALIRGYEGRLP